MNYSHLLYTDRIPYTGEQFGVVWVDIESLIGCFKNAKSLKSHAPEG